MTCFVVLLSEKPYLRVKFDIKLALNLCLNMLDNSMNLCSGSVVVVNHKTCRKTVILARINEPIIRPISIFDSL